MLTPKAENLFMTLQTLQKEDWESYPQRSLVIIRESLNWALKNVDKHLARRGFKFQASELTEDE